MSAKDPLQRLAVTSPCTQDWDSMIGNDRVRFCEHCTLQVHNISEMTRAEALRLAYLSNGRLCVRYYFTAKDEIVTRTPGSPRLYRIGRRVSRLTTGALSATLSISAAFAEPASMVRHDNAVVSRLRDAENIFASGGSLVGTVTDPNGALIPGVSVVITNAQTQFEMHGTTNYLGVFRFDGLAAGSYFLGLKAPGFAALQMADIYVDGPETNVSYTMALAATTSLVGGLGIPSPSDPFVKAAHADDLETLETLITEANVNLRDARSGTTALEHAVRNGNREMVQLLLYRGADVNLSDEGGSTPLMQLGEDATVDMVWDLINAGARINQKTYYGHTALMSAASRNNSDILKVLLEAGADVNAANEDGTTPLMIAASDGRVNNVRLLILAGVNIDSRDSEGRNAFMHALENEHKAVIRLLRSKGGVAVPLKKENHHEADEEN